MEKVLYVELTPDGENWIITDKSNRLTSTYDAIVDVNGSGDYTTIQDAFADGHRRIFIKAGDYTIDNTADMYLATVAEHIALVGEYPGGVNITFDAADYVFNFRTNNIGTGTQFIASANVVAVNTSTRTISSAILDSSAVFNVGGECYIIDRIYGLFTGLKVTVRPKSLK